jgi:Protein of unknown function (DUF2721)
MPLPLIDPTISDTPLTSIAHVIQLAVAPVFLLSGIAALLNVLSNRLSRIVDRARTLEAQASDASEERLRGLHESLGRLRVRAGLASLGITLCTSSAILISSVVIVLFLGTLFNANVRLVIAILFIVAMLALTAGLVMFLREIYISTRYLRIGAPEPEQARAMVVAEPRPPTIIRQ